jgi:ABC-type phosphonate transport system ATPase subunit
MLNKKEILALAPVEEYVELAGGKIRMRGLSAREYGEYERGLFTQGPDGMLHPKPIDGAFRARLVARCLTTEAGEEFTEEEVGDLDAGVVARLYDVARRLCGVSEADEKELVAGFAPAQADGSSSE